MVQKNTGSVFGRTNPKQANTQVSSVSRRPDWPEKLTYSNPYHAHALAAIGCNSPHNSIQEWDVTPHGVDGGFGGQRCR